jgi:predicted NACHT family NTPase
VIVTSRVIGYQRQTLDGAGFAHYMIQDLDTLRIHEFARRWYETARPGQPPLTEQLLTRLKEAVAHSRSVRELAGNPLLLTILAIIGRRQTLPRDRHGVYQHAVTVLVARWDRDAKHLTSPLSGPVAEALDLLGQTERLEMLRLLARRMQEGSGGSSGTSPAGTRRSSSGNSHRRRCCGSGTRCGRSSGCGRIPEPRLPLSSTSGC